ncbi:MAG: cytochrome c-type biogenesis protein CcmH [Solirubrobacteraceae bacterium]
MSRGGVLAALVIVVALLAPSTGYAATAPRASLTQIESNVMCVACHESLAVAQSPEAFSERAYIRQLIAQGLTEKQIENQLVAQYGPSVLAKPPAHGFNLLIYVLPPLLLVIGIATLVVTLPKWRRRSRAAASTPLPAGPEIDAEDARRLDDDLARHV